MNSRSEQLLEMLLLILTSIQTIANFISSEATSSLRFVNSVPASRNALETRVASQCFHIHGVPTLNLRCPSGQLIYVQQAFFGSSSVNTSCRYSGQDGADHCVQLTQLHDRCNGQYHCTIYVSNPYLMNCRAYAIYLQVQYTCVPKSSSIDVCSDVSRSSVHKSRPGGVFLRSPGYPDVSYSDGLSCSCHLVTSDHHLIVKVLDLSLSDRDSCEAEFVLFTSGATPEGGRLCGRYERGQLAQKMRLDGSEATVAFQTDGQHHDRGFWMHVQGSEGGAVNAICGPIAISRNKSPSNAAPLPSNAAPKSQSLPLVWTRSGNRTMTHRMAEVTRKVLDLEPVQHVEQPLKSHSVMESPPPSTVTEDEVQLMMIRSPTNDVGNFKANSDDNGGPFEDALQSYDFGAVRDFMKNNSSEAQLVASLVLGLISILSVVVVIVTATLRTRLRQ